MGILLNICWFSYIIRHIKLQRKLDRPTLQLAKEMYGDHSIKFDESAFDILKKLAKKKIIRISVPLGVSAYMYAMTISSFFVLLGFIQSLLEFIILPISFFFALYNWGIPITVFIIYLVSLYIIFIKIAKIFVGKAVLKDAEKFKFAYEGMIIRLEFLKFFIVAYPDEWVDTILKWNSWIEKLKAEVVKIKEMII